MAVPIPDLNLNTNQTDAGHMLANTGAISISPGGINFGEIAQAYAQPFENGGAAIYPGSRLFSAFNLPQADLHSPFVASAPAGSSPWGYALPLVALGLFIYALAR